MKDVITLFMMCVFVRLMNQLADVNTQSTVGMWHFYVVLHCCFCHWCRVPTPYFLWDTDSNTVVRKCIVACLHNYVSVYSAYKRFGNKSKLPKHLLYTSLLFNGLKNLKKCYIRLASVLDDCSFQTVARYWPFAPMNFYVSSPNFV